MNRRAFVSGSTRGIGKAIALELGKLGYRVTVHGRKKSTTAEQIVEELRAADCPDPALLCFDVADRNAARAALLEDIEQNGAFYGVVVNAGIVRDAPFPGLTSDDWDEVLHVNLDSFYNLLHPLTLPMIQLREGGRIVTISSLSGISGNRGQVNYSASKAGLIGATKALSKELAKRNITVNCVAPGLIESEMTAHPTSERIIEEMIAAIPMRRAGTPEEVSAAVSFFFSERASYITGQVLSVNGGIL